VLLIVTTCSCFLTARIQHPRQYVDVLTRLWPKGSSPSHYEQLFLPDRSCSAMRLLTDSPYLSASSNWHTTQVNNGLPLIHSCYWLGLFCSRVSIQSQAKSLMISLSTRSGAMATMSAYYMRCSEGFLCLSNLKLP